MGGEAFEDLIRELYECMGFVCISDIPGKPMDRGGRDQYDLVALHFKGDRIDQVRWIEITEYLTSGVATITNKFTDEKTEYLREHLMAFFDIDVREKDIKRYMYVKSDHPWIMEREDLGAELVCGGDLLIEIDEAITGFIERVKNVQERPDDNITLPDTFKHLKLIHWARTNSQKNKD